LPNVLQPIKWLRYSTCGVEGDYELPIDETIGRKTLDVDYSIYCTKELVDELFVWKDKLSGVAQRAFLDARRRANPYEIIGKSIFINRAAVKMANIDYLAQLIPETEPLVSWLLFGDNSFLMILLSFISVTFVLDLEGLQNIFYGVEDMYQHMGLYSWVYSPEHWIDKDFSWGMTLRGDGKDDWKFGTFRRETRVGERFQAIYGPDGTGSVYENANLEEFQNKVLIGTNGRGVHLFTADGGFCVDGKENYQELELKRLILCQFLCMFTVLGKGGNFVCKIFDCFSEFTVGLLYLLFCHFEEFSVEKPVTSRPANSERYVVCRGLKQSNPPVCDYLFKVNEQFSRVSEDLDVIRVVDPKLLTSNQIFNDYIKKLNIEIIHQQIQALKDFILYIEDGDLQPFVDQDRVTNDALTTWKIPHRPKPQPNQHYQRPYRNDRFGNRGHSYRPRDRDDHYRSNRDHPYHQHSQPQRENRYPPSERSFSSRPSDRAPRHAPPPSQPIAPKPKKNFDRDALAKFSVNKS